MKKTHFDVIILGAGVSGVGAACHLKMKMPRASVAVLERRKAMGGTWDLFKYPGIRSDSDMFTFGYSFRPWNETTVLASGPAIKQYVIDTAAEYSVDKDIHYGRKVVKAEWISAENRWNVEAIIEETGQKEEFTSDFIINCTGYYNYDHGYKPDFPGEENFKGQVIHPQHWPEDLDYTGKKVVVIGSGATAITLVPSMAPKAEHVTMLQRSPTYIASIPAIDHISEQLRRFLPNMVVYHMGRLRNIALQRFMWWASKEHPGAIRRLLLRRVRQNVGEGVDMKHFSPHYKPWDERLCVVPDSDLFKALKDGSASIVTDHIEKFTESGIQLKSGHHLDADIIVTATGLDVRLMGGIDLVVDGEEIGVSDKMIYKGVLVQDIPNAAIIFGYTNASWTLKVDIASEFICRLLKHMKRKGYNHFVPRDMENSKTDESIMGGLNAGYLVRAAENLPKNGNRAPWQVLMDYPSDVALLKFGPIEDRELLFSRVDVSPAAISSRRSELAAAN